MSKRKDHEGPIHKAILHYLELQFPRAVVHHSPNEVSLRGKDVARAIAKAKSLGMKPGFPDLIMVCGGRTIALEVKAPDGRLQDRQKNIGEALEMNGALWAVVRSVDDVRDKFKRWGVAP